jgi:hypothetical protein
MIEFALPEVAQTKKNLSRIALEGSVSFDRADGDKILAKWELDGVIVNVTYDLAARIVSVPNSTIKKRCDLLQAAIDRLNGPKWRAGVRALREMAQPAVGLSMEQLSKGENDAILKLLLLNQRAIEFDTDGVGRIRPLDDWVKFNG